MQAHLKTIIFRLKRKAKIRYKQVNLFQAKIKRRDRWIAELEKLFDQQKQIPDPLLIQRNYYSYLELKFQPIFVASKP